VERVGLRTAVAWQYRSLPMPSPNGLAAANATSAPAARTGEAEAANSDASSKIAPYRLCAGTTTADPSTRRFPSPSSPTSTTRGVESRVFGHLGRKVGTTFCLRA